MEALQTNSKNTSSSIFTGPNILGFLAFALGIIGFGIQFFVTSHGSSGQVEIEERLKVTTWILLTAVLLGIIGVIYYIYSLSSSKPFLLVFILAFSSFFFSNFALLLSLRQVNIVKMN
jgi:hypothetical protein